VFIDELEQLTAPALGQTAKDCAFIFGRLPLCFCATVLANPFHGVDAGRTVGGQPRCRHRFVHCTGDTRRTRTVAPATVSMQRHVHRCAEAQSDGTDRWNHGPEQHQLTATYRGTVSGVRSR
jgi:hypothetical protein